ncbi:unnamed protein product [Triticum turgidum subsp. durum]|uniref:RNA helicase n=1 Tax=Triticum turgidum subsp. durum TaxID=4567 RepID=A0A9R0YKS2_TRITD|nr:unnamed protein product [Triticum turgidum subsp. durum]
MGCNSRENKTAPEQELTTLPGKKKCFACKETSHNLGQCRIKDKLGTAARLFGHYTRFPFYMIQPSKEVVENEKFYHHCLLITSNTCNLDPAVVKIELNKFWKLTDGWYIKREGRQNFVASFNSEEDLLSCLNPPNVETFLDEKEVNFTVARWDEGDGEKLDLIREWLLVYGVPGAYRNWKELYQVASAVGVLLEVDEESLESGDKEPIRLRIALGSLVGAPFSYHFAFGWSSRLVKFMIEDKARRIEGQWKEVEERKVCVMKEYADIREGIEVPPETLDKGMDLEGTGIDFAGNYSLDFGSCSRKECKEELKTTERNGNIMKEYADIREQGIEVPAETLNEGMDLEGTGVDFTGNYSLDFRSCSGKECKEELKTTEGNGSVMMEYADIREEGIEVPAETLNEGMDLEGTGVDFAGNYSLDLGSCPGKECKEELKTTEGNGSVMKEYADIREEGIEVPLETLNKGMDLEGTGVDFAGNYSLDLGSCLGKECKEEPKTTETVTLLEVAKFIPELRADEEIKENSGSAIAATTTNSKKAAEGGQSPSESSARGDHMSGLEDCSDKKHQKKLMTCDMATILQVSKFTEEFKTDGEIKENNASAIGGTRTNSEGATVDIPKATEDMATLLQASKFTEELRTDREIKENNASAILGTRMNSERATEDIPKATEDMATLLQVSKFTEELRTNGEIKENNASAIVDTRTNSGRATEDVPKAEGGQSISGSSTSTSLIEEVFRGHKPSIKNVYTRRDRKQKKSAEGSTLCANISSDSAHEGLQKPPIKNMYEGSDPKQKGSTVGQLASKELNRGMNPGSSSHATRIATSTCNMMDSESLLEKEHEKEMKMAETAAKTVGAEGAQSIKGSSVCMLRVTQTKEGAWFDGKQPVSKITTRLTQFYEEFNTYNEIYDSFVEMGLQENLLKGIYAYGLEKPSLVHQRGIVPLCKGLDVIQQSLSGTTVTLACGVLQRLDYGSMECQALVLVPTRDLAQETEKVIGALGQWLSVKAHACLGGTSVREHKQILSSSTQVIVATPSRALDMLRTRALCPDNVRMLVLDEADEILAGGLKNQIYDIIQLLPAKIQFGVFSTTMSNEALELCRKCMNKPMKVIVPKDEELEGFTVKQFHVKAEDEELKFEKLCDLFDTMVVTQNIIFVNARRKVESLAEKISGRGYTVSASHGGMDQHARDVAVQDLRSGSSRVLVTTDIRGANAVQVPVVINYDLPTQPVQYLRHVRRSGQPGGIGVAISFVARADERVLSDIQRFCNTQLAKLPSDVADLL